MLAPTVMELGDRKGRPYAADFLYWDGKPVPYEDFFTLHYSLFTILLISCPF